MTTPSCGERFSPDRGMNGPPDGSWLEYRRPKRNGRVNIYRFRQDSRTAQYYADRSLFGSIRFSPGISEMIAGAQATPGIECKH